MNRQDWWQFICIGLLAGAIGWLNAQRVDWQATLYPPPLEAFPEGGQAVEVAAAKAAWSQGTHFFVDTRPAERFGQGHVQEAISLPDEDFARAFQALEFPLVPEMPLILYAENETDPSAVKVAEELRRLGFLQLQIIQGGWQAWQQGDSEP